MTTEPVWLKASLESCYTDVTERGTLPRDSSEVSYDWLKEFVGIGPKNLNRA